MRSISRSKILHLFNVDLVEGRLFWKNPSKNNRRLVGKEAGCPAMVTCGKIYWRVNIKGGAWTRGRLIYVVVHGCVPRPMLDHEDGNSLNDRPYNLRASNKFQNNWNHKKRSRQIALPMGVRNLRSGKFEARIGFYGKQIHLGSFDTPSEAHLVYVAKRKELYGEFA